MAEQEEMVNLYNYETTFSIFLDSWSRCSLQSLTEVLEPYEDLRF